MGNEQGQGGDLYTKALKFQLWRIIRKARDAGNSEYQCFTTKTRFGSGSSQPAATRFGQVVHTRESERLECVHLPCHTIFLRVQRLQDIGTTYQSALPGVLGEK